MTGRFGCALPGVGGSAADRITPRETAVANIRGHDVVLYAGMRLVVLDCWRNPSTQLLADGVVQRLEAARASGGAGTTGPSSLPPSASRTMVRFDRLEDDLQHLHELGSVRSVDGVSSSSVRSGEHAPVPSLVRSALASGRHAHAGLASAVIRYVQHAPGAPHRLATIGAALGVSPYHVAHVFREQTGLSVHRYLLRLRLAVALDLLAGGATNLSALALDLGFSSHSHFSSVFRRTTGLSPAAVRGAFLHRRSDTRPAHRH